MAATFNTCPKCSKNSPVAATFCGFCGYSLSETNEKAPVESKKTMFGYAQAVQVDAAKKSSPSSFMKPPLSSDSAAAKQSPLSSENGALAKRYSLQDRIHRLPAGDIYHATDKHGEFEPIDIFLTAPNLFSTPIEIERSRRELRQIQKVKSVRLISVLDVERYGENGLLIVLARVEGCSLAEYLSAGPLNEGRIVEITRELTEGLTAAQRVGVIHRDLAPHNITIDGDGRVLIGGFGIAPAIKEKTYGTAEYVSPEQVNGRPPDQRSLIYSIGALMYHMATGRPPFHGELESVLSQHIDKLPTPMSQASPQNAPSAAFSSVVEKALSKNSGQRQLTLRQLSREIDGIQSGGSAKPRRTILMGEAVAPAAANNEAASKPSTQATKSSTPTPPATVDHKHEDVPNEDTSAEQTENQQPSAQPTPQVQQPTPQVQHTATSDASATKPSPESSAQEIDQVFPLQPADKSQTSTATHESDELPTRQRPGFRETMWFYRGEVESALAEQGELAAPAEEVDASPDELAEKYLDDGSLANDEARRLSLRTNKTDKGNASKRPPSVEVGDIGHIADSAPISPKQRWPVVLALALGATVLLWLVF